MAEPRRNLAAFALVSLWATLPALATNVPAGTISADTTWTLAGSPYNVLGTVSVEGVSGADGVTTLTIEPGVEVRFAQFAQLYVGGTNVSVPGALIADGNAAGGPATIRFTADTATPTRGFWWGIRSRAGAHASTLLRNAEILYAGGGGLAGFYALHASGTVIAIDDVEIRESAATGIEVASGSLQVVGAVLADNTGPDVQLANSVSVGASFSGCTLGSVVYAGTSAPPIGWSNNTFVSYGVRTSRIDPDDLGTFAAGGTFTPVVGARTEVLAGTVAHNASWPAVIAPYVALGTVSVEGTGGVLATLTLAPGVEVRFAQNAQLYVGGTTVNAPGALIADGNAAGGPATIRFTADSAMPTRGFWWGIRSRTGAHASTLLRNAEVLYAGGGGLAGFYASHASGTVIAIDDVEIRECAAAGIEVTSGSLQVVGAVLADNTGPDVQLSNSPSVGGSFTGCTLGSVVYGGTSTPPIGWSGNTFANYGARTSRIDPDDLGTFAAGSTFTPVVGARTEVLAGTVAHNASWPAVIAPYVALGTLSVEGTGGVLATLTLAPGVEVRFAQNAQLYVGGTTVNAPGALIADGNAAGGPATMRFTADSAMPTRGSWLGIRLRTGAHASTLLRNAEILYAGGFGFAGIYAQHAAGTAIAVHDVDIRESGAAGIEMVTGTLQVMDSVLADNTGFDVQLANNIAVSASFTGCTLGSVFYQGVSATPIAWAANTFVNYGARTSRIDPDDLGAFAAGGTFGPVAGSRTEVLGGTVTRNARWPGVLAPYVVLGTLGVEGTGGVLVSLTLAPGVELRFAANTQLTVGGTVTSAPGALIADGNAAGGPATIRFTADSATPTRGFWTGLRLRPGAHASTLLRNAEVRYGGGAGFAGIYDQHAAGTTIALDDVEIRESGAVGIELVAGTLQVTGATIADNDSYDIRLSGAAAVAASFTSSTIGSVYYQGTAMSTISWSGNTFTPWGARTSRLRIADLDAFTHLNTFDPVPGAKLDVFGGVVGSDATWGRAAGPLVFDGSVSVYGTAGPDGRTTLTLEPGVRIRVPSARQFEIGRISGDPGALVADGAPGGFFQGTIEFDTSNPVPLAGDWNGLRILATGRAVLRQVQVRNATSAIYVRGTLGVSSDVTVNRSNVGLDLDQATLEGVLAGWSFRNSGIGVRATSTNATFRDGNLVGSSFGAQNLSSATHCIDAATNWWGAIDGPSGPAPVNGCETDDPNGGGSPITAGVLFDDFLDVTPEDGDGIACDDADGVADPCSGGNTVDCDDNCCSIANISQNDEDGDGVGDACDANPVLRVSSDPADGADFAVVQDAADATPQSGTRIEIFPGLGPYLESVRLDRSQVYSFRGLIDTGPVVIDGGTGAAFRVINKVGVAPTTFRDLTLRGTRGIHASVDIDAADMAFESITGEALQLDGGAHRLERATLGPAVARGAVVASGASLVARRVTVSGATDTGFDAPGSLTLENVLIAGGADGVRLGASGLLSASYVTVTDNTGVGIEVAAGGSVTKLDRSIVYDNALGDLQGMSCGVVTWTDTGTPNCSAAGDNLSANPVLGIDYRPQASSPCLDHGPDPATFSGLPSTDLDGGVRIADYDGDGFAANDCGAYETVNDALVPGEVTGVRWDFDFRLLWDATPSAVEYHVYRDAISSLSFATFGVCRDDLDAARTDTQLDDLSAPAPGAGFFYLITAESGGGSEGTLGFASAAERSNFAACP